jgi:hypothetical protein
MSYKYYNYYVDKYGTDFSMEFLLENANVCKLEKLTHGVGWHGTKWKLHTFNYGSSYECESFEQLKA